MNQPDRPDALRASFTRQSADRRKPHDGAPHSSYRSMLEEPAASLAGGSFDRPDVAAVAILGYN